jgi:hypothetical protein
MEATDITSIFGQRGSGKSELGKAVSRLWRRRVVIDILREWKKSDGVDLITDSFDRAAAFLHEKIGSKEFTLVVQFDIDSGNETQKQTFNALLRLLYKRGEITGENICLVIEEVHFFCGSNWIEEWLFKLNTIGRHANLAMIMSSQRPAQVHKSCISQAQNVLIGQLFEFRDIDYLRQTVGDIAEEIPKLQKYKFIFHRLGEPHRFVDRDCF